MSKMKLSEFSFDLPDELIAEYPQENRDEARLMVIHRKTGKIEHKLFKDIINYFSDGDVMITNNTKVFPARMYGNKEKTGAKIDVKRTKSRKFTLGCFGRSSKKNQNWKQIVFR